MVIKIKKVKGAKKVCHITGTWVYKNCLEATQLENKINQREKLKLLWAVFDKIIKNS